jgi:hypothetical protein
LYNINQITDEGFQFSYKFKDFSAGTNVHWCVVSKNTHVEVVQILLGERCICFGQFYETDLKIKTHQINCKIKKGHM